MYTDVFTPYGSAHRDRNVACDGTTEYPIRKDGFKACSFLLEKKCGCGIGEDHSVLFCPVFCCGLCGGAHHSLVCPVSEEKLAEVRIAATQRLLANALKHQQLFNVEWLALLTDRVEEYATNQAKGSAYAIFKMGTDVQTIIAKHQQAIARRNRRAHARAKRRLHFGSANF